MTTALSLRALVDTAPIEVRISGHAVRRLVQRVARPQRVIDIEVLETWVRAEVRETHRRCGFTRSLPAWALGRTLRRTARRRFVRASIGGDDVVIVVARQGCDRYVVVTVLSRQGCEARPIPIASATALGGRVIGIAPDATLRPRWAGVRRVAAA